MCRSIKTLRGPVPASETEIQAAARQFVRKISGFREPSGANQAAFERAVADVAGSSRRLLRELPAKRVRRPDAPPKSSRPAPTG